MRDINFFNYFINFTKMIAPETERWQGMFDTIINFTPSKDLCKTVIVYVFLRLPISVEWL